MTISLSVVQAKLPELCFKTARAKLEGASTIFQNESSLNADVASKKWAAGMLNQQQSIERR